MMNRCRCRLLHECVDGGKFPGESTMAIASVIAPDGAALVGSTPVMTTIVVLLSTMAPIPFPTVIMIDRQTVTLTV